MAVNTDSKLYKAISGLGKVGAVAGSVIAPPLAPGLLGAAFGGDKALKMNPIKSPIKPVKQSREMLAADLEALREDPYKLGLTESQQEKMRADATQAATAQNQAASSQLAQAALAGQGFQQGAFQQAQSDLAESASDAGMKAGSTINELNNRIIEQKKSEIMSRLDAERERAKENTRFWLNFGIQGVGSILAAAMGAPSPLGGLTSSLGGGSRDLTDYEGIRQDMLDQNDAALAGGS